MPQQITCVYDLCPNVTQKALHRLQLCSDQLMLVFKCRPHGTHRIGPNCSLSVKGKISDRMWVSFDKIHASMSQTKLLQGTVQVAVTKIILSRSSVLTSDVLFTVRCYLYFRSMCLVSVSLEATVQPLKPHPEQWKEREPIRLLGFLLWDFTVRWPAGIVST